MAEHSGNGGSSQKKVSPYRNEIDRIWSIIARFSFHFFSFFFTRRPMNAVHPRMFRARDRDVRECVEAGCVDSVGYQTSSKVRRVRLDQML